MKLDLDKYFLNKEHSLIMRELGFNEPCIFYFDEFDQNFGNITHSNDGDYVKVNPKNTMLPRPSYDQAFDFFLTTFKLSGNWQHNSSGTYTFRVIEHRGDATGWHKISGFVEKSFYSKQEAKNYLLERLAEAVKNGSKS